MEPTTENTDTPVEQQQTVPEPPTQDAPVTETVETTESQPSQTAPADTVVAPAEEPEEDYPTYQPVSPVPPIDFSQLPVDENNLIDPNALASQINSRIAQAESNAAARAQQIYAEQEQEKKLWDKAYEAHPDLKDNKELREMVHNARLGKVTEILSSTNDASQVKLPTPKQMADTLFKHITSERVKGFEQANQNTQVQQSAVLETSGKASDSSADQKAQALQNINNPNREVANRARNALLREKLGW